MTCPGKWSLAFVVVAAVAACAEDGAGPVEEGGGGAGAPVALVTPPPSAITSVTVTTVPALLDALARATPGSVVTVGADLDLTRKSGIVIPAQVTLAGDGGVNGAGGPRVHTSTLDTPALFVAGGPGVRVTGLRLIGPDPDIGATPYGQPLSRAINATRASGLRVDHCELSGWSHAAILLDRSRQVRVDLNSIHHNRRTGLGYGVVLVNQADALIERNTFDANRHAIAGTGRPGISYEARYNRVGATRNGHAFDMHGENEADDNGSPYAGDTIKIHHNTFLGTAQGIVIRGRPRTGAYIDANCFGQSSGAGTAIIQRFFTGNLHIGSNSYGQASGRCHVGDAPARAVRGDVNGDGMADLVTLVDGSAIPFLGRADGTLLPAPASFRGTMPTALFGGDGHLLVDVADVDGDLLADLVTAAGDGTVRVYRGAPGGSFRGAVESFAGTYPAHVDDAAGFEPIAVADVTGDGRGDLVSARAGTAYVHPGRADGTFGSSVASFAGTLDSARFDGAGHQAIDVADVTGDGRADLVTLHSTGTAYVYPGRATGAFGSSVASFRGTMNAALPDGAGFEPVGLGDVNGDGRADLVTAHTDGTTYVYLGQASGVFARRVDNFAGTMPTSLFTGRGFEVIAVLDVTGDGRADLVTAKTEGDVWVYPGKPDGAFAGGVRALRGFLTTREGPGGYEPASEKPIRRRLACDLDGCR